MNLPDMRTIVRRDLHDEDTVNYRWTDDEINRHILHALKEFSEAIPLEQKATIATTSGFREINISALTNRVMVAAVEYPVGLFPAVYQRFALWGDEITLLGEDVPDGSNCNVYYGKIHTLDVSTSTIPAPYEDIVAAGAVGYASLEWAAYATNRVNAGGDNTMSEFTELGKVRLDYFRAELKRLSHRNRVRVTTLYRPGGENSSQTTVE